MVNMKRWSIVPALFLRLFFELRRLIDLARPAKWKKVLNKGKPDTKGRNAHKYECLKGHIRIEKEKLQGRVLCAACEQEGKENAFRYMGKYTIPKSQIKKGTRF